MKPHGWHFLYLKMFGAGLTCGCFGLVHSDHMASLGGRGSVVAIYKNKIRKIKYLGKLIERQRISLKGKSYKK